MVQLFQIAQLGVGGLVRGYAKHLERCFVLTAKLLGHMGEDIKHAIEKGYLKLVIQTDNLEVTKILKQNLATNQINTSLMLNIKELIGNLENFKVMHIYREINTLADRLAKLGATSYQCNNVYEKCPLEIQKDFLKMPRVSPL